MKPSEFINQVQQQEIVAAIKDAEKITSGEIRVFVSRKEAEDAVRAAQEQFLALGMQNTKERNGVLIFVAPHTQKFAVIGDAGVHEKCGQPFWEESSREMSGHFRQGQFTTGLLVGIKKAGALLGKHFPCQSDDKNELSDDVVTD